MSSAFRCQRAWASASLASSPAFAAQDDLGGDQDVKPELAGQLVAGRLAVERLDRVADVGLVAQQPPDGGLRVRSVGRQADDRQARPDDVVLPQASHVLAQRELLLRQFPVMVRRVVVRLGGVTVRDRERGQRAEKAINAVSASGIGRLAPTLVMSTFLSVEGA